MLFGLIAAPPALLIGSRGGGLIVPAAAPPLGALGLAPIFPAVAGLAGRWRDRVVLAATGFVWVSIAEVVLRRDLLLGASVTPPRGWQDSAPTALSSVIWPLLSSPRFFAGMAIWCAAALIAGLILAPVRAWLGAPPAERFAYRPGQAPACAGRCRCGQSGADTSVGFSPRGPRPRGPALDQAKEPAISVLRNLEARIEGLVEGVFSRAFSSEVQPVELARKLAKEMDAHQTASVSRVYVPNEYIVHLSRQDRGKLEGYERSLEQELSGYLLEHARRRGYDLLTRPAVSFRTDERLRLGEFGIQTRLVKPPAREGESPSQGEEGHTMVYSAVKEREAAPPPSPETGPVPTRAIVALDDRRYVLEGPKATIGRSKDTDCVLRDPNVSRRHAELRRADTGDWQIVDLGSTNGIKVNGRRVSSSRLRPGDEVTVGTTTFVFDLEQ